MQGVSYDEALATPLGELKGTLQAAGYRELQGFLQYVGVNAAGKQAELLQRALEFAEQHKGNEDTVHKSKATGFAPPPRAQVHGKFRKAKSEETGASRARVLLEKALVAKQDAEKGDEPTQRQGKWTPELEAKRQEMQTLLGKTYAPPAELPVVPPLPGGDDSAKISLVLEKIGEMVVGINELRVGMSQTVKHEELKEFHLKHSQEIQSFVASKVDPVQEDVVELKSNVVDLMKDSVAHDDRIGKLESRLEEFLSSKGRLPDASFKRIVFKGFPEKISLDDRLECMKHWMEKNFPKIDFTYGVFHKGSFKDKSRKISGVGYAECTSSDIRDAVMDRVESGKIQGPSIGGKILEVAKARSQSATDRNVALIEASDLLKEQPGLAAKDVRIEWKGVRGVLVKGEYAYKQPPGKELGGFIGDFAYLEADS